MIGLAGMTLIDRCIKIIDLFITHTEFANDPFYRYRARFLVGSLLVAVVIVFTASTFSLFLSPKESPTVFLSIIGHGMALATSLIYFRYSGKVSSSAHIIVILFTVSIAFWVLFSGTIHSNIIMALIIMPLWAALAIGWRMGIVYCVVSMAIVVGMFVIDHLGLSENLPNISVSENSAFDSLMLWCITSVVVSCIGAIHGFQNDQLNTYLHQEKLRVTYWAERDTLTGIPNRSYFQKLVELHIHLAELTHKRFAIFYIDLDGFKPINDKFGHLSGDNVLQAIALRLVHELRSSDNLARLGGDEFAATIPNIENSKDISHIAERLLLAINEPIAIDGHRVSVSGSIGIAFYGPHGVNFERLTMSADEAMYQAKTLKNAYCVYSQTPKIARVAGRENSLLGGNEEQRI